MEFYKELDNGEAALAISSGTAFARVGLGLYSLSLDANGGALPPVSRSMAAADTAIAKRNMQRTQQQRNEAASAPSQQPKSARKGMLQLPERTRGGKYEGAHGTILYIIFFKKLGKHCRGGPNYLALVDGLQYALRPNPH